MIIEDEEWDESHLNSHKIMNSPCGGSLTGKLRLRILGPLRWCQGLLERPHHYAGEAVE